MVYYVYLCVWWYLLCPYEWVWWSVTFTEVIVLPVGSASVMKHSFLYDQSWVQSYERGFICSVHSFYLKLTDPWGFCEDDLEKWITFSGHFEILYMHIHWLPVRSVKVENVWSKMSHNDYSLCVFSVKFRWIQGD